MKMFPVQFGAQMKNRSSHCAHIADQLHFGRITGKPETTALGNVIDCAENRSTGVLDVDQCLQREIPGSMAARM